MGTKALAGRRARLRVGLYAACVGVLASAATAGAQNSISVGGATVVPGQQDVVLEVSATTTSPVTFLDVDIIFDPVLCGRIEMQTTVSPAEDRNPIALLDGVRCPGDGRVSIIALDFTGTMSIPPGEGPIGRWSFAVRGDAIGGNFPLTLRVNDARNGTLPVAFEVGAQGTIVIDAPIPTDTPTVPMVDTPTQTPPPATATPVRTSTSTQTPTVAPPTVTETPVEDTPTPLATETPRVTCVGDCSGDGVVTINELIVGVNIALGSAAVGTCPAFDANGNGEVAINELITGVNNALNGCPA